MAQQKSTMIDVVAIKEFRIDRRPIKIGDQLEVDIRHVNKLVGKGLVKKVGFRELVPKKIVIHAPAPVLDKD